MSWCPGLPASLTNSEVAISAKQPPHTGLISRLNAWLLSHGTDRYNQLVDEQKQQLFSDLHGGVLEIGPGTGANLAYYPEDVDLLALEPNPHMQKYLEAEASSSGRNIELITGVAEDIPLPGKSVDAVVSTLVLCSVDDLSQSLNEIYRVLKPGGIFLFIEHVAAPKESWLRMLQNGIAPCWRCLADGCHPNRETWKAIEASPFEEVEITHTRISLPVVGPHIIGKAQKQA